VTTRIDREGRSSLFRKEDATPQRAVSVPILSWRGLLHPCVARSPLRGAPRATLRDAPRRAEQSLPKGRCDPAAGCERPDTVLARSPASLRCPIPASRGPSGYALGSHRIALLGVVVPATTFVARLMIIRFYQQRAYRGLVQGFPSCRFSIGCSSEIEENEGSQSHSITPGDPG
jgi:hypothetical protein